MRGVSDIQRGTMIEVVYDSPHSDRLQRINGEVIDKSAIRTEWEVGTEVTIYSSDDEKQYILKSPELTDHENLTIFSNTDKFAKNRLVERGSVQKIGDVRKIFEV